MWPSFTCLLCHHSMIHKVNKELIKMPVGQHELLFLLHNKTLVIWDCLKQWLWEVLDERDVITTATVRSFLRCCKYVGQKIFSFFPCLGISSRSSTLDTFLLLEELYRSISISLAFRELPSQKASLPEGTFGGPWLCHKKKCCLVKAPLMITCHMAVTTNDSEKWTFPFCLT